MYETCAVVVNVEVACWLGSPCEVTVTVAVSCVPLMTLLGMSTVAVTGALAPAARLSIVNGVTVFVKSPPVLIITVNESAMLPVLVNIKLYVTMLPTGLDFAAPIGMRLTPRTRLICAVVVNIEVAC